MIFLDIESRSAHFRNHFYNSSLVSYPYPTRTMIFGMLASIIGYEHDSYHALFSDAQIAVCIKSEELYKDTVVVNHREPTQMKQATQVYIEYVKSFKGKVCYRIYYEGQVGKAILEALKNYMGFHLYLGATECLASVSDFGNCEYSDIKKEEPVFIDSNIPLSIIDKIIVISDTLYFAPKYERYRNIYGWNKSRGESLGSFEMLCETLKGRIYCKVKDKLNFSIAKLSDGTERTVTGKLVETSKRDVVYAF